MLESGAASFTLAVITSPKPARSPRSPPRGKMHCSLRAPLLSATSSIVRIPIMVLLPQIFRQNWPAPAPSLLLFGLLLKRLLQTRVRARRQRRMFQIHLHGLPNHVAQLPAL